MHASKKHTYVAVAVVAGIPITPFWLLSFGLWNVYILGGSLRRGMTTNNLQHGTTVVGGIRSMISRILIAMGCWWKSEGIGWTTKPFLGLRGGVATRFAGLVGRTSLIARIGTSPLKLCGGLAGIQPFNFWNWWKWMESLPVSFFSAPGSILEYIKIDVLHCCDLGVAQEALGNAFYMFIGLQTTDGKNQTEQIWHCGHL